MKTLVICGATGFIGKNLVEYFRNKGDYRIRAVRYRSSIPDHMKDWADIEWVQADLRDPNGVRKALQGADAILQFAATTSGAADITSKPYIHVTDNAVMNSIILREAFTQNIEHFVFPSCTVMYQPKLQGQTKEVDFDASVPPIDKYFGVGLTKVYIENMCEFYTKISSMKCTVIRHSNIYGQHDKFDLKKSHVFGATITKVLDSNEDIEVWGTGEETRDFLHVDDLLDFVDRALHKQDTKFALYNVGCGYATSILELVNMVIEEANKELEIKFNLDKPTIKTSLCLDCSKANQELGWKPMVSLREGVRRTLEWRKKEH